MGTTVGNNLVTLRPGQRRHITLREYTSIGVANEVVDYFIEDCFPTLTCRADAVETLCDHIERAFRDAPTKTSFIESAIDASYWLVLSCDLSVHEVAAVNMAVMRNDLYQIFKDYYIARSL